MKQQLHLFSPIFETEEECKREPFGFTKESVTARKQEYENKHFEGYLLKRGKNKLLKQRFFIYCPHSLYSFKVRM